MSLPRSSHGDFLRSRRPGGGIVPVLIALLSLLATPSVQARPPALPPMAAQGTVEVLFTPWDDAERALLRVIGQARRTIHIQAYTFSSRNIGWALGEAKKRGVQIEMLTDREQAARNEHSLVHALHDSGIAIWYEVRYAAAHNKVMIIDGLAVITGSFNFTTAAEQRNAENLLVIRDRALAARYTENWHAHASHSARYLGR